MRTLPALFLLSLAFSWGPASGQDRMDSQDALNVARSTALDRARNGYLTEALAASRNAIHLAEERLGPTHPSLCPYWLDNASLERALGLYEEAERSLQWTLALFQKNQTLADPLYPKVLFSLCALYLDWGKPQDAVYWGQKGLEIAYDPKGPVDAVERIQDLRLTSEGYQDLGDRTNALSLLAKARELCGQLDPPDPKLEIAVLSDLSKVQTSLHRIPEAQDSLDQALSIAKKLPEGSVELADTLEAQGHFWASQGAKEKAKTAYLAALTIYQKFVGSFYGYSNMGYTRRLEQAYLSLDRFKEAEAVGKNSLKGYQDSYGSDHPRVALALMELARAQKGAKETKEAGDNAAEALRILRLKFPPENPMVQEAKELAQDLGR